MVQFECTRHPIPCVLLRLGEFQELETGSAKFLRIPAMSENSTDMPQRIYIWQQPVYPWLFLQANKEQGKKDALLEMIEEMVEEAETTGGESIPHKQEFWTEIQGIVSFT